MNSKLRKLSYVFVLFVFATCLRAQDNSKSLKNPPPSDAVTGYTYDFDKAQALIIERILDPKSSNIDAQPLIDKTDFPFPAKTKVIDEIYKNKLQVWMEKNPNLIITILKNRSDIVHPF